MEQKIFVPLLKSEYVALRELAERERRDTRQQAALLIRAELQRRGLLPVDAMATDAPRGAEAQVQNANA